MKMSGRTGLVLSKHSPEILLVTGIASAIAGTILACRATLKVDEVMDAHNMKIDKIHSTWQKVQDGELELAKYSETDKQKDITVTYVQTAWEFIKIYGPAVSLGAASIVCILSSHGIMRKRSVALIAAYNALEEGFSAYRKRVKDEFGEEKEYMLRHGIKKQQVVESEVDKDGISHSVVKDRFTTEPGYTPSIYARVFDETCFEWTKDAQYNMLFLQQQQNFFNEMLIVKGHVFLNEVYDALGIPRSTPGSIVGWVISKGHGDNYIDFGIFNGENPRAAAFINGYERSVLLDFNVDGVIYDKI